RGEFANESVPVDVDFCPGHETRFETSTRLSIVTSATELRQKCGCSSECSALQKAASVHHSSQCQSDDYNLISIGFPSNSTCRSVSLSFATILRRDGGNIFEPSASRSVSTRRESCHDICTPIHSP